MTVARAEEKVMYTTCNAHCGGSCLLKVHIKDGVITRIETDDQEEPQFRACLKCRAYRQRVYAPDRILYPLKRVGERGEGKFQRVTWDEALDTVAAGLKRLGDSYGPASLFYMCSGGDITILHHHTSMYRVLCWLGGCTEGWGFASYEGGIFASLAHYGTMRTANTRDDLLNSRLIIMWGWDPASTRQNTGTDYYLAQAKEKGIRIVSVDPRHTDSTATFAQQWVPIKPGTDTAMMVAMAYVVITEELHDKKFLDKYAVGFDRFSDYVLGKEDGVIKTPAWAEAITGVPAAAIASLAREYATTKPAALIAGIGPGRSAYGEQYHRAAMTLAAMTGNVGIHGGDAGGRSWGGEYWGGEAPFVSRSAAVMRSGGNPVVQGAPPRTNVLAARGAKANSTACIRVMDLPDAILRGRSGGHPVDIKGAYLVNTNFLNQFTNTNKCVEAFKKLELLVVHEQFMTPTAKFADIILPVTTFLERNDITSGGATPFYGAVNKVIDNVGEARSHLEIGAALAEKVGFTDYNSKSEEEWLRGIWQSYDFPMDYDTFKQQGMYKVKRSEPHVAFKEQVEQGKPFPTPSGKIEIYSQALADMQHPEIPPIPKYIESWEGPGIPLASKYPLQLVTTHVKRRAHTQFENIPWLRELQLQAVFLSSVDARARGIKDGDMARIFNDRGQMVLPAKVTERIAPGVVDIPQGAWYDPDENGVDRGGCVNVLCTDRTSPGGAFASNTALVQIEKA